MLSFSEEKRRINIKQEIDNILIPVDLVIPIGIILNELITNSFKHAFPDKQEGSITVRTVEQEGNFILEVRDNGIGIPHGVRVESPKGMGFQILNSLSNQINCNLEMQVNNGTHFKLSFSEKQV